MTKACLTHAMPDHRAGSLEAHPTSLVLYGQQPLNSKEGGIAHLSHSRHFYCKNLCPKQFCHTINYVL